MEARLTEEPKPNNNHHHHHGNHRTMSFHDLAELRQPADTDCLVPSLAKKESGLSSVLSEEEKEEPTEFRRDDDDDDDDYLPKAASVVQEPLNKSTTSTFLPKDYAHDDSASACSADDYQFMGFHNNHGDLASLSQRESSMPVLEECDDDEVDASRHASFQQQSAALGALAGTSTVENDDDDKKRAQGVVDALAGLLDIRVQKGSDSQAILHKSSSLPKPQNSPRSVADLPFQTQQQQSQPRSLPRAASSASCAMTASTDDDGFFQPLQTKDRADSMPLKLSTSSPRLKPSLKSSNTLSSTTSSQDSGSFSSLKRTVSFGKLQSREYSIALSDHPSCSYGPPVALGWEYTEQKAVPLEEYENTRSPRRTMEQMVLSYNVRRYLLLKRAGYSTAELQEMETSVERVKRGRLITDLFLPTQAIDETLEEAVGHLKRLFNVPNSS